VRIFLPRVIGEPSHPDYPQCYIRQFAEKNRQNPTRAERRFLQFLTRLNKGVLRKRFLFQHPISGKWIVDFFFPEIRLAIELDGGHHKDGVQAKRDRIKEEDCRRFDITLARFTNAEVFGSERVLVERMLRNVR
jgi:very-short-patch-repair endonuclease